MAKGFCIGLLPIFACHPTSGLHSADNGLPAGVQPDAALSSISIKIAPMLVPSP
jgi:hypothetical protein